MYKTARKTCTIYIVKGKMYNGSNILHDVDDDEIRSECKFKCTISLKIFCRTQNKHLN